MKDIIFNGDYGYISIDKSKPFSNVSDDTTVEFLNKGKQEMTNYDYIVKHGWIGVWDFFHSDTGGWFVVNIKIPNPQLIFFDYFVKDFSRHEFIDCFFKWLDKEYDGYYDNWDIDKTNKSEIIKSFWNMAKLALENIPSDGSDLEQNCLKRYDTIANKFNDTINNV